MEKQEDSFVTICQEEEVVQVVKQQMEASTESSEGLVVSTVSSDGLEVSTVSSDGGLMVSTISSDGGLVVVDGNQGMDEVDDDSKGFQWDGMRSRDGSSYSSNSSDSGASSDRTDTEPDTEVVDGAGSVRAKLYTESYRTLFGAADYVPTLTSLAVGGGLRNTQFRSLVWRVLLGVLPTCPAEWPGCMQQLRENYGKMQEEFSTNTEEAGSLDPSINNPLSQAQDSPWHQHFLDSELRKVIWQDVARTFPGVTFFQDQAVRETMVSMLFIYARAHPRVGYKQGMHELLGPLYFVIVTDYSSFTSVRPLMEREDTVGTLPSSEVFREGCQEADTFHLFQALMEAVGPWYVSERSGFTHGSSYDERPWSRPQDMRCGNKVVDSLNYVQDVLLKRHDPALYSRLEKLEIFPQIYGIRWLRLLFGREFVLSDTLVLWDAILGVDRRLSLADQLVVSLLVSVRDLLLKYDYPDAVQLLMKLPSNLSVSHVISSALHLKDPLRYSKPSGSAFSSNHPKIQSSPDGRDRKLATKPDSKFKKISAPRILAGKNNNAKNDKKPIKLVKLKHSIDDKDPKELPEFTVVDIKHEEFEKIEEVPDLSNQNLKNCRKKDSFCLGSDLKFKLLTKIDILNHLLLQEDLQNKNDIIATVKELKSLCITLPPETRHVQRKGIKEDSRLQRTVSEAVDVENYFKEK